MHAMTYLTSKTDLALQDLAARLAVAAGLEEQGEPLDFLDSVADSESEALAREAGSYCAALESVRAESARRGQ